MALNLASVRNGGGIKKSGISTKRILLWLLLVAQASFIACFWLLQNNSFSENAFTAFGSTTMKNFSSNNKTKASTYKIPRVNFIIKDEENNWSLKARPQLEKNSKKYMKRVENVNNFLKDFYIIKLNRLIKNNVTEIQPDKPNQNMIDFKNSEQEVETEFWCFREGTLNASKWWRADENSKRMLVNEEYMEGMLNCKCNQQWHGTDCSQPEIIWRASMLTKRQIEWRKVNKQTSPHRLIYMLEGYFYSLDLLELQIESVAEVVDFFIIYWKNFSPKQKELNAFKHKLRELFKTDQRYMLIYTCPKDSQISESFHKSNCTTHWAYKHFRHQEKQRRLPIKIKSTDLLLYTRDREIIMAQPLKFLKYYATNNMRTPIKFRLKHNVYGFFLQHPKLTHQNGDDSLLSSFAHVDINLNLMAPSIRPAQDNNGIVLGDLNHYGGWHCEYCQQPNEIIDELNAKMKDVEPSVDHVQFPNVARNRQINSEYVQRLIAQGIYLDGKIQLQKLRRYTDKYYAPPYAERFSWKFGNLLSNLYEKLNEDTIYDEESY